MEADHVAVIIVGMPVGGVLMPLTYLESLSPDGISLFIIMLPREEFASIGRMVFLWLTALRTCKKSQMNGLMG